MTTMILFHQLYTRYYDKAIQFTMLYVRDQLVAEDIVMDAFMKLWKQMQKETIDKPLSFLLVLLKNKSLDYLRAKKISDNAFDTMLDWQQKELNIRISTLESCYPDDIFSNEIHRILDETLASLSSHTRQAFMMSRFEHKSLKEIADILGISVKGVDYHISKALKALRISLKDYLPIFILFIH